MVDKKNLDSLVKKLMDVIPPTVRDLKKDLEKNFRAILQTTLVKMNLVTREEFDVQTQILRRTREKLDTLEKKINTISRAKKTRK